MLRLSVSKDEYLMVGTEVRITVLKVDERSVELMIDAPREVNVARGKAIRKRAAVLFGCGWNPRQKRTAESD